MSLSSAASRLLKLAKQRRISCGRGESNFVIREVTTYTEAKVFWHVKVHIYCM